MISTVVVSEEVVVVAPPSSPSVVVVLLTVTVLVTTVVVDPHAAPAERAWVGRTIPSVTRAVGGENAPFGRSRVGSATSACRVGGSAQGGGEGVFWAGRAAASFGLTIRPRLAGNTPSRARVVLPSKTALG
eukprot:CAMPEP_0180319486 /NCGR_PEP_ID=MMETSP0988-20121125/35023_1 /TAXON_ID=697907 /ORGANISM="non described non described, Strain CCMP2293" /LENGTH=130 /DNA_ID=CAMNT_0022305065 /DNA_START=385 /DNA_END=772 /DNA_ORIENTATION=+